MTVTTTMPDDVVFGKVVGRFLLAVGDSFDDDRLPDATPASGTITFSPVVPNFKVNLPGPATVVKAPIRCSIDNTGRLLDTNQAVGVWLIAGHYRVTYALEGMTIDSHTIEVTTDHDDDTPLDLTNALPPSGPVLTPTQYSELSGRIDALDMPVDSVNGMVGDVILDAADVGAYSKVETDDKFATQQALTDAQFAAIPSPPVTSVNGEVGDVQLTAGEVGAYTKAEVDTRVNAAKFSAAGATDGFVATADGAGGWAWEEIPLPPDTGSAGTYRGPWDSARLYETGDQVTIGGTLWVATEPSQGATPATTVQINPAGGDGGPGSYSLLQMYGNVQQVMHPIRTNRDVLLGSIKVLVHEVGMPAIKVGISASAPTPPGSAPAVLMTPATSSPAIAGTGWKEVILDDPIPLQAETNYWIYLESASGLGQLNGHFNNGYVAYSGALEGPPQAADFVRSTSSSSWALADRRTYIQIGEYEPQAWEPLADLTGEVAAPPVTSVNGRTGAVNLVAADLGAITQAAADGRYAPLGNVPLPRMRPGFWYTTEHTGGSGGNTIATDVMRAMPFTVTRTGTLTAVGFLVNAVVAGGLAHIALYRDQDGAPGAKFAQTDPIETSSLTGFREQTISGATVTAGETIWLVARAESVTTFRSFTSGLPSLGLSSAPALGGPYSIAALEVAAVGDFPATWPAGAVGISSAPIVFVKY